VKRPTRGVLKLTTKRGRTLSNEDTQDTESDEEPIARRRTRRAHILLPDSDDDQPTRPQPTRILRARSVGDKKDTGELSDDEELALIAHYTNRFVKHMQTIEQQFMRKLGAVPVATRMRKLKLGKTYGSLTLLHDEYSTAVEEQASSLLVQVGLKDELQKFIDALPWWSPTCKTESTAHRRRAVIEKLFRDIAMNAFVSADYQEYRDPDNVL
jgi:hypothetical protein